MTWFLNTVIKYSLFILLCFASLPLCSDVVILTSGEVMDEIEILEEAEDRLTVRTRHTTMDIHQNRIQSYEKDAESRRRFFLGNARYHLEAGEWQKAREEARQALALHPDCEEGFQLLREIEKSISEERMKQHMKLLEEARRYKEAELWEDALPLYEEILDNITLEDAPTLYRETTREIAVVYLHAARTLVEESPRQITELQKAQQFLEKVIQHDDNNADAFFLMGITEELLDRNVEALQYYQKALEIDSTHQQAHENFSRLYYLAEQEEDITLPDHLADPDILPPGVSAPEEEQEPDYSENNQNNGVAVSEALQEEEGGLAINNIIPENLQEYLSLDFAREIIDIAQPFVEDYWQIALLLVLFILIYWIIPVKHFERNALNKPFFLKYKRWVKILGIFTYLFYFFERLNHIFSSRAKKGDCPYCRSDITDFYSWTNFDFAHCPHCGHEFEKPFFKPRDYLYELAHDMAEKQEIYQQGDKGMGSLVEKENITFFIQAVLSLAIDFRSTDLHFEPSAESLRIRNRVDGLLYDLVHIPMPLHPAIVSALKIRASLDISEKRRPQDGKFRFGREGTSYDIRISTAPTQFGEKVNLRILPRHHTISTYAELGMEKEDIENMKTAVNKNLGLVLSTGPTGSGKTTTLYTILQQLNTGDQNIITLEDPIEYEFKGINQMQVNQSAGFTFANGLRSILRQDPDIIMVGEIRDTDTAEIGVNAALTGHLVLSTLHTIDAVSTITRLIDMNVDSTLFASALNIIIAQRLMRVNCQFCTQPYKPETHLLKKLGIENAVSTVTFHKGTGCEECNNIGYLGRTGIFEILVIDDKIKELIEKEAGRQKILDHAQSMGMKTLKEKALHKVFQGVTTVEETIRVIGA